ncbi:MAG: hypothetical protein KF799_00090 [Bdellovibrionales bacterium]|nr:hypothetical protein [Bdellovibrionales bacterium]
MHLGKNSVIHKIRSAANPQELLQQIAMQRAVGRPWEELLLDRQYFKGKQLAEVERVFNNPLYRLHESLTPRKEVIGPASSKKKSVRLFPATFRSYPCEFFSEDCLVDFGSDCHLYAMYLSEEERKLHFEKVVPLPTYRHLQSAFAFIRYYVRESAVVVVEIQCDLYRLLKKSPLKDRYVHWNKVIMMAFERHIRAAFSKTGTALPKIVVAGRDYHFERWAGAKKSLSAETVRINYTDTPSRLGYEEASGLSFALERPDKAVSLDAPLVPIKQGWSKDLAKLTADEDVKKLDGLFDESFQVLEAPLFTAAYEELTKSI